MAPGKVKVFWLLSSFFLELVTYCWDLLLPSLCLHSEPSPRCRVLQTFSAGTGSRQAPFPLLCSPPHRGLPPEAWLPVFLADPCPHLFPCLGEPLQSRLVLTSLHWPQGSPRLTGDSGNGKRSAWAVWGILGSPLLLPCPHGSAGTGRGRRSSGMRRVFLCVRQCGPWCLEMLLVVL